MPLNLKNARPAEGDYVLRCSDFAIEKQDEEIDIYKWTFKIQEPVEFLDKTFKHQATTDERFAWALQQTLEALTQKEWAEDNMDEPTPEEMIGTYCRASMIYKDVNGTMWPQLRNFKPYDQGF